MFQNCPYLLIQIEHTKVKKKIIHTFLRDHPLFSIQRIIQIQMKHLRHNLNIEHRFHLKRYHAKTLMGHGKI